MISAVRSSIGIVIPWFGRDLKGGAEQQAWQLATRLAQRGHAVEVLTTCCKSFQSDWSENHYAAGCTTEPEGFSVRRFPVQARNRGEFDRVCGHLLSLDKGALIPGVSPITEADERIFSDHLIRSPELLEHLRSERENKDAFLFLPYLYGTTLEGIHLVGDRGSIIPCLHDESYAYLRKVRSAILCSRRLLWNSDGELELATRLFGPGILGRSVVAGEGVEPASPGTPAASANLPEGRFLLVLGRKDSGKGTFFFRDIFRQYPRRSSSVSLVFAGPGDADLNEPEAGILDLGLVDEPTKGWLIHNCTALVQPSLNESYSRVVFEAFSAGRPVIARSECLATATAVRASRAGWVAEDAHEWHAALDEALGLSSDALAEIAARARDYAKLYGSWESAIDRIEAALLGDVSDEVRCVRFAMDAHCPEPVDIEISCCGQVLGLFRAGHSGDHRFEAQREVKLRSEVGFDLRLSAPPQRRGADPRVLGIRIDSLDTSFDSGPALVYGDGFNLPDRFQAGFPRWTRARRCRILVRSCTGRGAVHQILPNFSFGDAISNHALWIREQLQKAGFESEIFARHLQERMLSEGYPVGSEEEMPKSGCLIYHHSIGSEVTPWVLRTPLKKAILYHNITPEEFFRPYRPEFADLLGAGRRQLAGMAHSFAHVWGDSQFNTSELDALGFHDPKVLPLAVGPRRGASAPCETLLHRLADGLKNILFVGRLVPNKRHEDLIYLTKLLRLDNEPVRLVIVGSSDASSFYAECLKELVRRLNLGNAVHFVGHASDEELEACYRTASVFACMSEHEGFCVPLIEAMWHDVPVVAFNSSAVLETLGDAGIRIDDKSDMQAVAGMLRAALFSRETRSRVIAAQRINRQRFRDEAVSARLLALVGELQGS